MKFIADKISKLTDEDGKVIISLSVSGFQKQLANMTFQNSKDFEEISVEIKQHKKNRSLDQNAMLWSLITKLSQEINGSRSKKDTEELYCQLLEKANVNSVFMIVLPKVEETLKKLFRVVIKRGEKIEEGKTLNKYQCWVGSSQLDTKEMNELIEYVLDELASNGIFDTETEMARYEIKKK